MTFLTHRHLCALGCTVLRLGAQSESHIMIWDISKLNDYNLWSAPTGDISLGSASSMRKFLSSLFSITLYPSWSFSDSVIHNHRYFKTQNTMWLSHLSLNYNYYNHLLIFLSPQTDLKYFNITNDFIYFFIEEPSRVFITCWIDPVLKVPLSLFS